MSLSPTYPVKHDYPTPQQTWTFNHKLKRHVSCTCVLYIDGTATQVLPKDIQYPDLDTVKVIWSKPYAGMLTVR